MFAPYPWGARASPGCNVTATDGYDSSNFHRQLTGFLHDCLAAQTDRGRAFNVVDQKDVTLLPLAASEQEFFGRHGELTLADPEAIELGKRYQAGGKHVALTLGALFVVGRIPPHNDRTEKRFCGPLLEVPLRLRQDSEGRISLHANDAEFSINYSLLGELLRGADDDLQDRLAELAQRVPNFPIDPTEFDSFWREFTLVAPEVPFSHQAPTPRRSSKRSTRLQDLQLLRDAKYRGLDDSVDRLEMVDFYLPRIPKENEFRLLPATGVVLGKKAGRSLSALSELRAMQEMPLQKTAFAAVFDPPAAVHVDAQPTQRPYPDDVHPLPLTPTQAAIVESARTAPLTVVTGPPGTGKSYTITAIVLDALLNGQTVLVASQMDKAVEVVSDHVAATAGPLAVARSGGRSAQRSLAAKVSRLTGPRGRLDKVTDTTIHQCAASHYELTRQRQQLESHFRTLLEAERSWSDAFESYHAATPLLRESLAPIQRPNFERAVRRLERARRNIDVGFWRNLIARWDISRIRKTLQSPPSGETSLDSLAVLLDLHHLRFQMLDIEASLAMPLPSQAVVDELEEVATQQQQTAIELVRLSRHRQLRKLVTNPADRAALRNLALLLRRRNRVVKRELQSKLSTSLLLETFPAWACTTRTLCEILPATPASFDLVVIDESSQCDLALASVALMRAKRAVVVGDPQQLRHVCFLSHTRENAAFVRHGLTPDLQERFHYRRSLFDLAADNVSHDHFFFLDEHFRSHPHLIEFSNQRFYEGQLNIMTSRPAIASQSAIEIVQVAGRRDPNSNINPTEVAAVAETVHRLVAQAGSQQSIAVVSPFRDHADAIRERLLVELSANIWKRHSIVIGTAHSLQGDEKDVVVLSTSIDPNSHTASLRFLESPNLFNVAITRARSKLVIVTSVLPEQLPQGLLREYLVHAADAWSPHQSQDQSNCPVEGAVMQHMAREKVDFWAGFRAAGQRINLVAMGRDGAAAVLCDSGRDRTDPGDSLESHRRLQRAGWAVIRIPHRAAQQHWKQCRKAINKQIGS